MGNKEKDLQRFERMMGYKCNLSNPKTHNERVMNKKYTDRNPLLTLTSDKIRVKEYVDKVLGENDLFSQRIYSGYDLDECHKHLTESCVIKMNNASGRNLFITSDEKRGHAINYIKQNGWMTKPYGFDKGEWGYNNIVAGVVVENIEFFKAHDNYRFLCFNGEPEYVQIHNYELSGGTHKKNYCTTYDKNFNFVDVIYKDQKNTKVEKSVFFDEMIGMARKLSNGLDFVRVDFMCDDKKLFFGEMTHYPVSGKCKFTPREFDYKMGELWKV